MQSGIPPNPCRTPEMGTAAESETRLRRTETFVAPIQVPFGACQLILG